MSKSTSRVPVIDGGLLIGGRDDATEGVGLLDECSPDSTDAIGLQVCDDGSWRKASEYAALEDGYDGAAMMEGIVAVWGTYSKYCFFIGLGLLVIALQVHRAMAECS